VDVTQKNSAHPGQQCGNFKPGMRVTSKHNNSAGGWESALCSNYDAFRDGPQEGGPEYGACTVCSQARKSPVAPSPCQLVVLAGP
jgi:hypothetical protein